MNSFSYKKFFDLTNFQHSKLFEEEKDVWKALEKLPLYIEKILEQPSSVQPPPNIFIENPSLIHIEDSTVVIEAGAYIKGPCFIGSGSVIRHGAYIRENVLIGRDCVVGHCSEIKNSILLDNVQAAHFNYVGDSILGNHVRLGAGVKCANLRFDEKPIVIKIGTKKFETGTKKFGAILGDNCQIGCNGVTNPGTILEKGVKSLPCLNISGYITADQLIRENL